MPQYYIITTSPENFERDRKELKFIVQSLKDKQGETLELV